MTSSILESIILSSTAGPISPGHFFVFFTFLSICFYFVADVWACYCVCVCLYVYGLSVCVCVSVFVGVRVCVF